MGEPAHQARARTAVHTRTGTPPYLNPIEVGGREPKILLTPNGGEKRKREEIEKECNGLGATAALGGWVGGGSA